MSISFCWLHSFHGLPNKLNKLTSLQRMGLHSSAGRALQRECRGHGFEFRSPRILFFPTSQLLIVITTAMVRSSIHLYLHSSHHFILGVKLYCILPLSESAVSNDWRVFLISITPLFMKNFSRFIKLLL